MDRRAFILSAPLASAACASPTLLVNLAAAPPPPDSALLDAGKDLSGRMTVPVRLNGQGPFTFVVDTGANRTVVATDVAEALGLPSAGPADIHGVAGVEPAQTATVETLDVDRTRSRNLRAPLLPRARLGADGLLGIDVLRDRRVLMDFRDGTLSVGPPREIEGSTFYMRRAETGARTSLGNGVSVPARYRFGQLIIVGATVSGRRVTAFLDSGAQTTVGNVPLRRIVLGDPPDPKLVRYVTSILSATGQTAEGQVGMMRLLTIGGLRIVGLQAVFAPLHVFDLWDLAKEPSLLIGIDVMGQFNAIELDYSRRRIVFYPKAAGRA
jgi:predicted aspartyl protease